VSGGEEGFPLNKQLLKYLRTRAVSTPWLLNGSSRTDFSAAVIVPALAESQFLPATLHSLAINPVEALSQTLVLIVVNNCANVADELRSDNRQLLAWLQTHPFPELNLAWIDACSPGLELPAKGGVGLARKLGFDLALPRLDWATQPLLVSLDADTLVDSSYLPAIFSHFQTSRLAGATLPFRHQSGETPAQDAAIRRYELYLRSYLFGLQQAGSPYAYHTIGSAFACTAAGYVAAGGMSRRAAAEDFYFLQQLAKTSGVEMLKGTLVRPSPRFSARVPFGTGQAVQAQLEGRAPCFQFCPAEAFQVLKDWLFLVNNYWQTPGDEVLQLAARLSAELEIFLVEFDFCLNWQKLQQNYPDKKQFTAAFHRWFDGLRTRQLLMRLAQPDAVEDKLVMDLLQWGGCSVVPVPELLAVLENLQHASLRAGAL
jgi:hypothetical protein